VSAGGRAPSRAGIGDHGEAVSGPPAILGQRGSPLEAPENTLSSLRRALDVGLDGIAYDARACGSGELVLLHDETLDRTTDARGLVAHKSVVELSGVDAGGWFAARFKGEPLPLLEEALELEGDPERGAPFHVVALEERGLVAEVAHAVHDLRAGTPVRIASRLRDVCLEARDAGLPTLLLAAEASERDRRFVEEHGLAAYGVGPRGWSTAAGALAWSCERWGVALDEPADLLEACRRPLFALTTNEPLRALATRALVRLAPHDEGPYPVVAPELEVIPGEVTGGRGDWCGAWTASARVRNPFPHRVLVTAGLLPRHGAFDIEGVPVRLDLAPGEETQVPFALRGGSWRTGGDPLFFALYRWRAGPGRAAGRLLLDAPLHRVRTAVADVVPRRLVLLREAPDDRTATITIRRHRRHLLVSIESAGGLEDARTIVHLDGRTFHGGRGVRVVLPEDFDQRAGGVAFSCGLYAYAAGERKVRRWAGGVPDELGVGAPGRLVPASRG